MLFLARLGLALYSAGLARSKNSASILIRAGVESAAAVLVFFLVGRWMIGVIEEPASWTGWLMQLGNGERISYVPFLLLAGGIGIAAAGERLRSGASLIAAVVLAVAFSMSAGWVLRMQGVTSYSDESVAAAGVLMPGMFAFVLAVLSGPRTGKFNRDGSANYLPGHSLPLALTGLAVLLLGVVMFVDSRILPVNVLLAPAASLLVTAGISRIRFGRLDVPLLIAAVVGGVVVALPSVASGAPWKMLLLGVLVGAVMPTLVLMVEMTLRVDDSGNIVAATVVPGLLGLVAVPVSGAIPEGVEAGALLRSVALQGAVGLTVAAVGVVAAAVAVLLARLTTGLRLTEAQEYDGADLCDHDVNAYPDFQQNMIKSYHLRER